MASVMYTSTRVHQDELLTSTISSPPIHTYLLYSTLNGALKAKPLELALHQLVGTHEWLSGFFPVRTQWTTTRLLRVELGRVPFWLVVLQILGVWK